MATLANQGVASQASFGQHGSAYLDSTNAYTPPSGKVVVAISLTSDCTFATLRQEASTLGGTAVDESVGFFGTGGTDQRYSGGGIGDTPQTSSVFPKGLTIYGRWDSVDLNTGTCILYFGPAASPIQTA
tara:strand:+ start:186 stop:572 length:387 start_codon:yes stop_codon:yes gene_type:complete